VPLKAWPPEKVLLKGERVGEAEAASEISVEDMDNEQDIPNSPLLLEAVCGAARLPHAHPHQPLWAFPPERSVEAGSHRRTQRTTPLSEPLRARPLQKELLMGKGEGEGRRYRDEMAVEEMDTEQDIPNAAGGRMRWSAPASVSTKQ